ncbi:serine hydrolase domain-containing protein [Shewanella sp. KX20019]|uniref:serine hydrolase domain-containing protein n=1 Tax=Shewanella sp. KX20019 TaxID=2803864 RepID=UPI001F1738D5|nr:serine hydrolase [Shewanella sp. KX20019]
MDFTMCYFSDRILIFLAFMLCSFYGHTNTLAEGIWQGVIVDKGVEQRLVFTIKRNKHLQQTVYLDAPDDGWMRIPASISCDANNINIDLPLINASLNGKLVYGGKFIEAEFAWQGELIPIRLKSVMEAPRASASIYNSKLPNTVLAEDFNNIVVSHPSKFKTVINKAKQLPQLNSILIYSGGQLVIEEYFNQLDQNTTANIKSVNKSLLSILVGIAIDKKFIDNLDEKIAQYLPSHKEFREDRLKNQITIRDLLNMRAGLEFNEMTTYRFGAHPIWDSIDWVRAISELQMSTKPGELYNYGTVQTHLLSAVLTKATSMDTLTFANLYLFHPLNIRGVVWYKSQKGIYMGGSDMFLTPREMMQVGLLYLNNGKYRQQQIVSQQWIERSLIGDFPEDKSSANEHYGYLWKGFEIAGYSAYRAAGYGGQYIVNVPELDTSIVTTANPNYLSEGERNSDEVMLLVSSLVNQIANDKRVKQL